MESDPAAGRQKQVLNGSEAVQKLIVIRLVIIINDICLFLSEN